MEPPWEGRRFRTAPDQSRSRVFGQIRTHFPAVAEERMRTVLGGR